MKCKLMSLKLFALPVTLLVVVQKNIIYKFSLDSHTTLVVEFEKQVPVEPVISNTFHLVQEKVLLSIVSWSCFFFFSFFRGDLCLFISVKIILIQPKQTKIFVLIPQISNCLIGIALKSLNCFVECMP